MNREPRKPPSKNPLGALQAAVNATAADSRLRDSSLPSAPLAGSRELNNGFSTARGGQPQSNGSFGDAQFSGASALFSLSNAPAKPNQLAHGTEQTEAERRDTCASILHLSQDYVGGRITEHEVDNPFGISPTHLSSPFPSMVKALEFLHESDSKSFSQFIQRSGEVIYQLKQRDRGALRSSLDLVMITDKGVHDFIDGVGKLLAAPIKEFISQHPTAVADQSALLLAVCAGLHEHLKEQARKVGHNITGDSFVARRLIDVRESIIMAVTELGVESPPIRLALGEKSEQVYVANSDDKSFPELPDRDLIESLNTIQRAISTQLRFINQDLPTFEKLTASFPEHQPGKIYPIQLPRLTFLLTDFLTGGKPLGFIPQSPNPCGPLAIFPEAGSESLIFGSDSGLRGFGLKNATALQVSNKGKLVAMCGGSGWTELRPSKDWFPSLQKEILAAIGFAPDFFLSPMLPTQSFVITQNHGRRILLGLPEYIGVIRKDKNTERKLCMPPLTGGVRCVPLKEAEQTKLLQELPFHIPSGGKILLYAVTRLDGKHPKGRALEAPEIAIAHHLVATSLEPSIKSFGELMSKLGCNVSYHNHSRVDAAKVEAAEAERVRVSHGTEHGVFNLDFTAQQLKQTSATQRADLVIECMHRFHVPIQLLTMRLLADHALKRVDPERVLSSW